MNWLNLEVGNEEFPLKYNGSPDEAIKWCRARGHRAFAPTPSPGTFAPCLLVARDAELVGIAEPGDVLIFNGSEITIRIHS